ncbi:hypothetical protein [Streptodolium elevatio]|uniref:Uncharacterized protein n=1 Tax=Streptodolium elevatio TaxID=3157996 RepID=A0ABV3DBY8_9ACTN
MKYLIKNSDGHVLAEVEAEETGIYVERADDPDIQLVSIDLNADGEVTVGHWPDGEQWVEALSTYGSRFPN